MIQTPAHLGGHGNTTHVDDGAALYLHETFAPRTVLDLGCGPGGMKAVFENLDIEWTGIDGDPALEELPGRVRWDFTKGPYTTDQRWDLCWSCEFVEHVAEQHMPHWLALVERCAVFVMSFNQTPGPKHPCIHPEFWWIEQLEADGWWLDGEATHKLRRRSNMRREFMRTSGLVFLR